MGITREHGYSASVTGFFVTSGTAIPLAKINGVSIVFAESCELPPNVTGELLIVVDGEEDRRTITLPHGSTGELAVSVQYRPEVPF